MSDDLIKALQKEQREDQAEITRLREDQAEITRLREENARLREALKTFALKAPVQLTYEGRAFIKAIIMSESELAAARAAIREGEKGDGKNS